jgi:hypothetical protein
MNHTIQKDKVIRIMKTGHSISKLLLLAIVLMFYAGISNAQPVLPQRTITVLPTQAIHFGTIIVGNSGGTVIVGSDGSRTKTGDIILLSMSPSSQPAIFEIKLCQGRNVNISIVPSIILTGSNGGPTLTLDLGPTEKGDIGVPFPTNADCNFITPLRVGGTLHVPGSAIPGTFTGSFSITFNQE